MPAVTIPSCLTRTPWPTESVLSATATHYEFYRRESCHAYITRNHGGPDSAARSSSHRAGAAAPGPSDETAWQPGASRRAGAALCGDYGHGATAYHAESCHRLCC